MKYLIISPQAGFGNRIRALASGILLAQKLNRVPLLYWEKEDDSDSNLKHIADIKKLGFTDYFEPRIQSTDNVEKVDLILSEWGPGDYWFQFQNRGQRKWKCDNFQKVAQNLSFLASDEYQKHDTILLETSLSVSFDGFSQKEISSVYQTYFQPVQRFLDILDTFDGIDIGLSIRRGEFLYYFPEANQDVKDILDWSSDIISIQNAKNMVIFSDDFELVNDFKSKLSDSVSVVDLPSDLEAWESGFLQFLILAIKCKFIYGTPRSSFAEEAALFDGGFHYHKILHRELPRVTIAILCKNKASTLPLYLKCIYNLNYPKKLLNLYIRTNDNTDNSEEILREWIQRVADEYNEIYFDASSINTSLKKYGNHEWNGERFQILGRIREESVQYAIDKSTDYFVIDCDNFVKSNTLRDLVFTGKNAIAPLLRLIIKEGISYYSNYHHKADAAGYLSSENRELYNDILLRKFPGLHQVDVIHCTYYLRNRILKDIIYLDETGHHEYVVFSRNLRNLNIPQFIDNREVYGYLTFEDTYDSFINSLTFDVCKDLLLS